MHNNLFRKIRNLLISSQNESTQVLPSWGVPNPKSSDIYLVSYPKSGNTWMRYLMAYAIWPDIEEIDLVDMASYIPSFRLEHDRIMMLDLNSPCNQLKHRVIKEHTTYNDIAKKHIKKAIYIVRDGRDAIVSYWHFCNQRDQTSIPLSEFIEYSAITPHYFGSWKEHVIGWLNAPLEAKLVIRYEDLLCDTAAWLKIALNFIEIEVSDILIDRAVNRASFNSMKKLEKTKGFNLEQLRTVEFMREGKQGSWINTFSSEDLEQFNRYHGGCLKELGYI